MRKRALRTLVSTALVVVATTAIFAGPALAIRHGSLDGNDHPFVGIMVAQDAEGDPLWRCTGTLLSDTVFLTAGHCVESPAAHIEIWFEAGPVALGTGYPAAGDHPCNGITGYPCSGDVGGTPHGHPDYDPDAFWTHDLGVVTLDASHPSSTYGDLPALNSLDSLKVGRATWFTAVGYGLQASYPDAAGWKDRAERTRMVAHPWLKQINRGQAGDIDLILTDNAAGGGTCFGDSGGPNFLGDSTLIAGVNSYALNDACGGTAGVYRIDKADDVEWLATFFD
jgi:trypsin